MKIDDTTPQRADKTPAYGSNEPSASYAKGSLDSPDLKFLNMMLSLGASNTPASRTPVIKGHIEVSAFPTDKPSAENSPSDTKAQTKIAESKAEMARLYDEISRVRVANELDMLQSDLKAGDLQFLEQVLLAGLPYQGGVPFQQLIAVNAQGQPEFSKLNTSDNLSQLLTKAYKSGRPLRVELDSRSSVVLKFHGGKVSAEFLTQDPGMALYLKQYMDELRHRLINEKELPIAQLSYQNDENSSKQEHDKDNEQSQ